MQKWEYCVVGPIWSANGISGFNPRFIYFGEEGMQFTDLQRGDEQKKLSQIISNLGDDSWELVGCGNTAEFHHFLYFKRPKT